MKTCEEYAALISDFLDGELSAEDRAEVAAHLAACPACQQYFDDLVTMHDAFDQIEEVPVPEGFAEQIMDRVRETPQTKAEKIIFLPHWKRWAALAACCAIVALGLWSAQRWAALPWAVKKTALAESAPSIARDASEETTTTGDAPMELMMDEDGEDGGVFPQEVPEPSPEEEAPEERKQCRDASGSGSDSLPEIEEDIMEEEAEADAGYSGSNAYTPEPAMPAPAYVRDDRGEALSGVITASGEIARTWVENELSLAWEPGRTYLLTEEEYAGLLSVLTAAGEDFRLEPEEGCWLVAE